jgi:prepilin-type N-terminal cleavage/methylation domain-containing protein
MADLAGAGMRRGAEHDGGFTLIESLTAATILLIIAVAVITTLVTTGGWYAKARMRTEANAIANEVMAKILSRNAGEIHYADSGKSWADGGIQPLMPWDSAYGPFAVETSLTPTVDPSTGTSMTQVVVTAYPQGSPLDPPVSVIRYASGWQNVATANKVFKIPVEVQIIVTDNQTSGGDSGSLRGVRVQLLDSMTLAESRYAVTDDAGVARFADVAEGQYFLTCDPRFGTDIRPRNFPVRIYPTHGGAANNPILATMKYNLMVVRRNRKATLRVGAFQTAGFTNPQAQGNGTFQWTSPPTPYKPVEGLVIYARPNLNNGAGAGTFGTGATYPDEKQLLTHMSGKDYYSGTVNAYGVANIEIDWTTDHDAGQTWTVWCTTVPASNGVPTLHQMTTDVTGSWSNELWNIDLPSDGRLDNAPQWDMLGTAKPINTP